MSSKREKKSKDGQGVGRWIKLAILLMSGSGAGLGGWELRDHPILERILGVVSQKAEEKGVTPVELVKAGVETLVEAREFKRPGRYEVKLEKVSVDKEGFRVGQTVNIVTRVLRRDQDGKDTIVWTSKSFGERSAVVGKDQPVSVSWADQPFEIDWKPGDRYVVEVWDQKTWRPVKLFEITADGEDEFPLRTQTLALDGTAKDKDPTSFVALTSRRVRGDDSDKGDAPAVAEKPGRSLR